jgi:predicted anti-sigma-YlaC factor YlaD
MFTCKEAARLVSESLDREPLFHQRLSLRLHLLMCSLCRRFRRQMLFLREAARSFAEAGERDELPEHVRLSPPGRARIQRALEDDSRWPI